MDELTPQLKTASMKTSQNLNAELTEEGLDSLLTLNLLEVSESQVNQRKLMSRIIAASNIIAQKGRRGTADYVFLHPDWIEKISNYTEDGRLAGIKVIENSSLENSIIVASKGWRENDEDARTIEITIIQ